MDRVATGASDFRHARRSRSPTRRAALGAVVEPAAGDAGFIGWSDAPARGRCQPAVPVFALAVPDFSSWWGVRKRKQCGRPAKSELREYVREFHPHVLHFAGHGGVDGQNAALLFDAPAGTWPWSSAQIASDLAGWQWNSGVCLSECLSERLRSPVVVECAADIYECGRPGFPRHAGGYARTGKQRSAVVSSHV